MFITSWFNMNVKLRARLPSEAHRVTHLVQTDACAVSGVLVIEYPTDVCFSRRGVGEFFVPTYLS